jgi:hypothetical protein
MSTVQAPVDVEVDVPVADAVWVGGVVEVVVGVEIAVAVEVPIVVGVWGVVIAVAVLTGGTGVKVAVGGLDGPVSFFLQPPKKSPVQSTAKQRKQTYLNRIHILLENSMGLIKVGGWISTRLLVYMGNDKCSIAVLE